MSHEIASQKERKKEAVRRLQYFNLHENVIAEFKEEDKLNCSEEYGMLFWVNDDLLKEIKEIEIRYNLTVYHVIKTYTNFGLLYNLLYVSKYKEDWLIDEEIKRDDCVYAYVINKDDDTCSEFGEIQIKRLNDGLIRIA